jgi:hypothetical protein
MDFIQVRPLLETNHISGPWVGAVYIGAKYVQFGSMEVGAELPANTTDVPRMLMWRDRRQVLWSRASKLQHHAVFSGACIIRIVDG